VHGHTSSQEQGRTDDGVRRFSRHLAIQSGPCVAMPDMPVAVEVHAGDALHVVEKPAICKCHQASAPVRHHSLSEPRGDRVKSQHTSLVLRRLFRLLMRVRGMVGSRGGYNTGHTEAPLFPAGTPGETVASSYRINLGVLCSQPAQSFPPFSPSQQHIHGWFLRL